MTRFTIILSAFLTTAGLFSGAPGLAQSAQPKNVTIVRTADLDLTSKIGRQRLEHRLINAAYDVCSTASDADLEAKIDVRKCRSDVLAKARSDGEQLANRNGVIRIAISR